MAIDNLKVNQYGKFIKPNSRVVQIAVKSVNTLTDIKDVLECNANAAECVERMTVGDDTK